MPYGRVPLTRCHRQLRRREPRAVGHQVVLTRVHQRPENGRPLFLEGVVKKRQPPHLKHLLNGNVGERLARGIEWEPARNSQPQSIVGKKLTCIEVASSLLRQTRNRCTQHKDKTSDISEDGYALELLRGTFLRSALLCTNRQLLSMIKDQRKCS